MEGFEAVGSVAVAVIVKFYCYSSSYGYFSPPDIMLQGTTGIRFRARVVLG